jgi:hypothetical protein
MDIFLSHHPQDQRRLVKALEKALSDEGIRVQFQPEPTLRAGERFRNTSETLGKADAVVLVIGPRVSEWQREEWRAALEAQWKGDKRVIPLLLPDADVPPFLHQTAAIRLGRGRKRLAEAAAALAAVLKDPSELSERGQLIDTRDEDRREQARSLALIEDVAKSLERES